ncbi:MAG: ABC transporter permease, partial [Clostridia bacterium]|nr:ABC transporter permease [Clostridia bacterium]
MISYIIKRCLRVIPLLLLVSIVMFLVLSMLPGNAVTNILSDMGTTEQKEQLEARFGLDLPVPVQYWKWLTNFIRGDMGTSFLTSQPVVKRLAERVPVTLEMILLSIVLAVLIGVPIGILCAVKRGKAVDYVMSTVSMFEMAMPQFWIGMLFILLFAVNLNLLPASGFTRFSVDPLKNLRSMIMPSITLALSLSAGIIRQTRSAMLDAMHQDY